VSKKEFKDGVNLRQGSDIGGGVGNELIVNFFVEGAGLGKLKRSGRRGGGVKKRVRRWCTGQRRGVALTMSGREGRPGGEHKTRCWWLGEKAWRRKRNRHLYLDTIVRRSGGHA